MTSRTRRILTLALAAMFLVVGGAAALLVWGWRHVPSFYVEALAADPQVQQQNNSQMLANASALANDLRKRPEWSATFTADQINGWLAVDLPTNHPDLLPPEISHPRVQISPGRLSIACRYDAGMPVVALVDIETYVTSTGEFALRIHRMQAGALPIPLRDVLDGLSEAAEDMNLRLRWQTQDGDPVALVTLPAAKDERGTYYVLDTIELREGAVYLAGRTQVNPQRAAAHGITDTSQPAEASGDFSNRTRPFTLVPRQSISTSSG